jgi:ATP-dependent Clp protease protease subunit
VNYYIPQWEERTSYGFRRIDPYAKLFEDRIIFLGTPISDDIANAVMAQLLCLESMDPDRDINIYINSPGGSFTALTAIYDTMRFIKPDVQTVCLGQAASAAAILLAAGSSGKRLALPNSRILIHQPYTEGTYGQSSDIEIQANEILRMRELLETMNPDTDISIYINSPGGSFTALTAIYDTMRFIKPDVQTVCLGQAASAAAILLAAGAPGKRLALPNSRILIHQPYTEGTFGQTSDIEIQANEILRMRELLEKMIAEHSGKSTEEVSRDIERDKILTAEQAVEYGLIDAVIESRKGAPVLA